MATALPQHTSTAGPEQYDSTQNAHRTYTDRDGRPVPTGVYVTDSDNPSVRLSYDVASQTITMTGASLSGRAYFRLSSLLFNEIEKIRKDAAGASLTKA